ncbi:vitamin K epoxide reductase family protein [Botrimarina sp.]|uniref:vitamin K epoxide reductase family protein n=1 Tax=Botrimarina sp. TaxID=2795802 RepID=UPI0032EE23BD
MPRLLAWLAGLFAATALGLSAYLLWAGLSAQPVFGCSWSVFDCDSALASRWSKWLGMPVAAGGVACYGAALVGVVLAGVRRAPVGWRVLEAVAPLAVGAGVWFVAVQAVWLESFCLYCLLTHAAGLLMAIAIAAWRAAAFAGAHAGPVLAPIEGRTIAVRRDDSPPALGAATFVGVLALVALVTGQLLVAPPTSATYAAELDESFRFADASPADAIPAEATSAEATQAEPPPEADTAGDSPAPAPESDPYARQPGGSRNVSFLGGRLELNAYDHPVLGSPEAPTLIVEMMDYACPHCREFHDKLARAIERFEGQVGVIVMPVPSEISCNPHVRKARAQSVGACYVARLSIAVAELAPDRFGAFHAEMLKADTIPGRTAALLTAQQYVDADRLREYLRGSSGQIDQRVKRYVDLAAALQRSGRFGLPTQILGDKIVVGPPDTVDALCQAWNQTLGLKEPSRPLPF